jgi:hypothetical protein
VKRILALLIALLLVLSLAAVAAPNGNDGPAPSLHTQQLLSWALSGSATPAAQLPFLSDVYREIKKVFT